MDANVTREDYIIDMRACPERYSPSIVKLAGQDNP